MLLSDTEQFMVEVLQEAERAVETHGDFHSLHEAYGVILEEVDEFWDEVKKKAKRRDADAIRAELVQIAAMCLKTAIVAKGEFVNGKKAKVQGASRGVHSGRYN